MVFDGTVTAGTAYMFDEGARDALLVEAVPNDITADPTDDYIVVVDGGAVIGLNEGTPNNAINGLKYYLEGDPGGYNAPLTPVGFVSDGGARSDAMRNTDPQASISPTDADGIRVEGVSYSYHLTTVTAE